MGLLKKNKAIFQPNAPSVSLDPLHYAAPSF